MNKKLQQVLLLASSVVALAAHAAPIETKVYQIQILKNNLPFTGKAPMVSSDDSPGRVQQFQQFNQLQVDCNGAETVSKSIDRTTGTSVTVHRSANIITADITIMDAAPQQIPAAGSTEKCAPITPSEQIKKQSTVQFIVENPEMAEFNKDIGDGFSITLKASQIIH